MAEHESNIPQSRKPGSPSQGSEQRYLPLICTGSTIPECVQEKVKDVVTNGQAIVGLYPRADSLSQTLRPLCFGEAIALHMNESGQIVVTELVHVDWQSEVEDCGSRVVASWSEVFGELWSRVWSRSWPDRS